MLPPLKNWLWLKAEASRKLQTDGWMNSCVVASDLPSSILLEAEA